MGNAHFGYSKVVLSTAEVGEDDLALAGKHGVNVLVRSFIAISYLHRKELLERVKAAIASGQPLVFSSQHAVRSLAELLVEKEVSNRIYCVGSKTQYTLNHLLELSGSVSCYDDASQMAQAVIANSEQAVAFFCGNKRLPVFPDLVSASDIEVTELEVYKTELTPERVGEKIDGVLFYSPSGVDSFFSCNELAGHVLVFVIGETTAAAVRKHCKNSVFIAPQADKSAVVRTAIDYYNGCCY